MSKIKLLALMILMMVVCLAVVSCGNTDETTPNAADPNVPGDDSGGGSGSGAALDELFDYPEHDFDGAVINFLARQDGWADGSQDFEDFYVETETGEVLNDAVFRRNRTVEEKYNVEIKVTYVPDANSVIANTVRAGDDEYQIVQEKLVFMSATLAVQNFLMDFNTVQSMNLDAPWYNQNAIKDLAINNKVTTLGGDMTVSDKVGAIMTAFNKRLAADFGIENLYATVKDGKWTLDKLYEVMMQTTIDLNGDGTLTLADDQWGLIMESYGGWMFAVASGNRLASLDDSGLPYMTAIADKFVNDMDRIKTIMYQQDGRIDAGNPASFVRTFTEGRAFMSIDMLSQISLLRGMDEDFGIIPLPKQDENQQNYITPLSAWVSRFMAMPSTVGNPETVGAVIDAMSRESTDTVTPAYFDNLLNNKIARDEESVEMLKLIFDSVVYDIGSVFSWGNIWDSHRDFINSRNEDYIGWYERIEGSVEAALERTINAMQEFD